MYAMQRPDGVWGECVGNIVFSPTVYQTAESLSDEQREEFGVYLIVDMPTPELTREQKLGEPICVINGTTLERTWPVVAKTAQELLADTVFEASIVRSIRNDRIRESDWTQLDDTPLNNAQKIAWAQYRQALRDIPSQPGFPWDVVWPTQP